MRTLLLIYNPHAGKGRIVPQLHNVIQVFQSHGYLTTLYATQGQGDGVWAAAALGGDYDRVVCCGGDGTLSEVVTGLHSLERMPLLGYLPAGTTNDFSKTLELPSDLSEAAELAVTGYSQPCDVGRFNDNRLFSYVAAFGVFTETSYATPQPMKNLLGHTAYVLEGIKSLASLKTYHVRAVWAGGELEDDVIYAMVSNSVSVGGFRGMRSLEVVLDDGLFEVFLVRAPKNAWELQQIAAALLARQPNENFLAFQTDRIRFTSAEPIAWTLDGEFGGEHTEVSISNLPSYVTILSGRDGGQGRQEGSDDAAAV